MLTPLPLDNPVCEQTRTVGDNVPQFSIQFILRSSAEGAIDGANATAFESTTPCVRLHSCRFYCGHRAFFVFGNVIARHITFSAIALAATLLHCRGFADGAALVYTSAKDNVNCSVLHRYLLGCLYPEAFPCSREGEVRCTVYVF